MTPLLLTVARSGPNKGKRHWSRACKRNKSWVLRETKEAPSPPPLPPIRQKMTRWRLKKTSSTPATMAGVTLESDTKQLLKIQTTGRWCQEWRALKRKQEIHPELQWHRLARHPRHSARQQTSPHILQFTAEHSPPRPSDKQVSWNVAHHESPPHLTPRPPSRRLMPTMLSKDGGQRPHMDMP